MTNQTLYVIPEEQMYKFFEQIDRTGMCPDFSPYRVKFDIDSIVQKNAFLLRDSAISEEMVIEDACKEAIALAVAKNDKKHELTFNEGYQRGLNKMLQMLKKLFPVFENPHSNIAKEISKLIAEAEGREPSKR